MTPIVNRGYNENGRVASLESEPITLNFFKNSVTSHLNHLVKVDQIKYYNIILIEKRKKIIPEL